MKSKHLWNKAKSFVLKNKLWIISFFCLAVFLALAEEVFDREIMRGDVIGYELISRYLISDFFTPIAKVITNFGGAYIVIFITFVLVLFLKERREKALVVINLISVTAINQLLKQIVQRPRPTEYRIVDASGYSFPSGHSMVSMAFYGYIIYLIYKNVKQPVLKWTSIILLGVLIFMIGISRIYLGVHYTSDVLAGFMLSLSYLIIFIKITGSFMRKNGKGAL